MLNSQKTILITGVLGQDGSYLAQRALQEGHRVVGGIRGAPSKERLWRLHHLGIAQDVQLIPLDLLSTSSIDLAIEVTQPDIIFNLGAQSSVGESFNTPLITAEAGAIGPIRIFEKARFAHKPVKVFQASSSEIFGDITDSRQTEATTFNPKTPYGATKLFAHIMAEAYRVGFGTFVSTGILFNHESPLRGENFVTKKIVRTLAQVRYGQTEKLLLGNIDAKRDWSHALDFVSAIWNLMALEEPNNIVLASGKLTSVREFVEMAAQALDFDIQWQGSGLGEIGVDRRTGKQIVAIHPDFYRPFDPVQPIADISKAQRLLDWTPAFTLEQLVQEMIQFEINHLKQA